MFYLKSIYIYIKKNILIYFCSIYIKYLKFYILRQEFEKA